MQRRYRSSSSHQGDDPSASPDSAAAAGPFFTLQGRQQQQQQNDKHNNITIASAPAAITQQKRQHDRPFAQGVSKDSLQRLTTRLGWPDEDNDVRRAVIEWERRRALAQRAKERQNQKHTTTAYYAGGDSSGHGPTKKSTAHTTSSSSSSSPTTAGMAPTSPSRRRLRAAAAAGHTNPNSRGSAAMAHNAHAQQQQHQRVSKRRDAKQHHHMRQHLPTATATAAAQHQRELDTLDRADLRYRLNLKLSALHSAVERLKRGQQLQQQPNTTELQTQPHSLLVTPRIQQEQLQQNDENAAHMAASGGGTTPRVQDVVPVIPAVDLGKVLPPTAATHLRHNNNPITATYRSASGRTPDRTNSGSKRSPKSTGKTVNTTASCGTATTTAPNAHPVAVSQLNKATTTKTRAAAAKKRHSPTGGYGPSQSPEVKAAALRREKMRTFDQKQRNKRRKRQLQQSTKMADAAEAALLREAEREADEETAREAAAVAALEDRQEEDAGTASQRKKHRKQRQKAGKRWKPPQHTAAMDQDAVRGWQAKVPSSKSGGAPISVAAVDEVVPAAAVASAKKHTDVVEHGPVGSAGGRSSARGGGRGRESARRTPRRRSDHERARLADSASKTLATLSAVGPATAEAVSRMINESVMQAQLQESVHPESTTRNQLLKEKYNQFIQASTQFLEAAAAAGASPKAATGTAAASQLQPSKAAYSSVENEGDDDDDIATDLEDPSDDPLAQLSLEELDEIAVMLDQVHQESAAGSSSDDAAAKPQPLTSEKASSPVHRNAAQQPSNIGSGSRATAALEKTQKRTDSATANARKASAQKKHQQTGSAARRRRKKHADMRRIKALAKARYGKAPKKYKEILW